MQTAQNGDLPDLAQHHLHAMEIAQHLGDTARQRGHGQALLALAVREGAAVPATLRRQALERLGNGYQAEGKHRHATQHYAQALALVDVRSGGNAAAQALALCALLQRMAASHAALGETAQALQCWQRLALYVDSFDGWTSKASACPIRRPSLACWRTTQLSPPITNRHRSSPWCSRPCAYSSAVAGVTRWQQRVPMRCLRIFLAAHGQTDARRSYLKKALLLVQICDPDNSAHLQQLKTAIREAA
ncbi:hypothetical protein [Comamonas sp. JC664]|uniref:hypothetical protein n=1 Tax=Comamonas sp. JC664 TaxID=2801917 RepID=UPI0036152F47